MPRWCQFNGEQVHKNAASLAALHSRQATFCPTASETTIESKNCSEHVILVGVKAARTRPNQPNGEPRKHRDFWHFQAAVVRNFTTSLPKIPHPDSFLGGGRCAYAYPDEEGQE